MEYILITSRPQGDMEELCAISTCKGYNALVEAVASLAAENRALGLPTLSWRIYCGDINEVDQPFNDALLVAAASRARELYVEAVQ